MVLYESAFHNTLFVNKACTFLYILRYNIFTNAPTVNTYECEGYVPP